jgi:predicted Ser/Thr protein kinase
MGAQHDLLSAERARLAKRRTERLSIRDYLEGCRDDPMRYATASQRMLAAIGEPQVVDTQSDARLGRIFLNRTIKVYPAFAEFYGMEETIERIVGFFRHAAQGLEERKQILYLLGPVGGGKSSLAERLKTLMEANPIYVLAAGDQLSPVFESPLGLFDTNLGDEIEAAYGIPKRYLTGHLSPWAVKRLDEFEGDLEKFSVVKLHPSKLRQIGVAKTEPGDENNQDISALVGKIDIRQLEHHSQNDPDAYSYSGGLNRCTQGMLEFVEMFKAPIKMLHPLLTATQDGTYVGTENIGALPFQGVILAHSNESEWKTFKSNRNNEAFLDRICVIKVPYCLRVSEEKKIYDKLLSKSDLASTPCAPGTLDMMARFSVLTRLKEHENSNLYAKMRVYDGESLKQTDPNARSMQEYRDAAGVDEGMDGLSTRFAYKILSETFNFDSAEVAADPVHQARAAARRDRGQVHRVPQGGDRAALRRVHRQRDPEGLSRKLSRLRPEPVRPLRRLCRRLGGGSGLQGPRHRSADGPWRAERGADQDREARGDRQPQGLPLRGGQVLPARPRPQRGPQSRLDLLREDPRRDREADVQPGRGPAAGHQLRGQEGRRRREEAHGVSRPHDGAGLHSAAGSPAGGLVHARQEGGVSPAP